MDLPAIEQMKVPHNSVPWGVKTNRHTTTDGRSWGWIEGAPGNVCWTNGTAFDRDAASLVCRHHNEWLKEQTPIALRLIEAEADVIKKQKVLDSVTQSFTRAERDLFDAYAEVDRLKRLAQHELKGVAT